MSDISVQLDEHLSSAIAIELRRRGIDILTADDAGLRGAPDTAYVSSSLATSRVLVTYDRHFAGLCHRQVQPAGIVYVPRGNRSIGEIVETLIVVHGVFSAEEMIGRLEYL